MIGVYLVCTRFPDLKLFRIPSDGPLNSFGNSLVVSAKSDSISISSVLAYKTSSAASPSTFSLPSSLASAFTTSSGNFCGD